MTKLKLSALHLVILALAGCTQTATDPAKASTGKPGTAQTQPAAADPTADFGRGGAGGGGGAGGY